MYPNGEHFARPLANGDWAVLLLNRLPRNLSLTLLFTDIGDTTGTCFGVRDVWAQKDLGPFANQFRVRCGLSVLPQRAPVPEPTTLRPCQF